MTVLSDKELAAQHGREAHEVTDLRALGKTDQEIASILEAIAMMPRGSRR